MCGKYWQYKSPGPPAGPPISLFVGKLDTRLLHLLFSLSFFLLLSSFNHSSHTWLLLSLFLFPSSIRLYLAFLFPVRSSIPFTFIVSTSINLLVPLPATVRRAIRLYPSFSTAIVPTTFNHLHFFPEPPPLSRSSILVFFVARSRGLFASFSAHPGAATREHSSTFTAD